MKIRLTKPLPQIGRVVPIGAVIDAPEPFKLKLIRSGRAVWADDSVGGDAVLAPPSLPVEEAVPDPEQDPEPAVEPEPEKKPVRRKREERKE